MTRSCALDLYTKYFRLILPAIAVVTAVLWALFGARIAIAVFGVLVAADMVVLLVLTVRSMKKRD